jgi:hypothetical protein
MRDMNLIISAYCEKTQNTKREISLLINNVIYNKILHFLPFA